MRKQWMTVLSMLGLAGPAAQAQSPKVKSAPQAVAHPSPRAPAKAAPPVAPGNAKLAVNQQKLRTQTPGGGKQADTMTPSAYCNAAKPGGANAVTKGSANAVTKGGNGKLAVNQQKLRTQTPGGGKQADTMTPSAYCNAAKPGGANAVTKGSNAEVTKGTANAVTKGGNVAVTKGGANAVTKGSNAAITKGSANAVTKGGATAVTKGSNAAITK